MNKTKSNLDQFFNDKLEFLKTFFNSHEYFEEKFKAVRSHHYRYDRYDNEETIFELQYCQFKPNPFQLIEWKENGRRGEMVESVKSFGTLYKAAVSLTSIDTREKVNALENMRITAMEYINQCRNKAPY